MISKIFSKLSRKKYISFDSSPLPRVLSLTDLTALGIGSTVGVGFYILAGEVSRNTAGPAIVISFLIAGIASLFAGLCYAEFGARVPKAGSAYVYSYICVGEFIAFIIGWNLILEYVIGTASVARGFSSYVDDLLNNAMSEAFNRTMHMDFPTLSPYPDFFAFSIIIIVSIVLSIGVKESTRMNNIFTALNIFVILYVIIAGSTQADTQNWKLSEDDVHNSSICSEPKYANKDDEENPWGTGGFAPYGFAGVMKGAATCFFGFVGFDVIATTGEEAMRPERNIPLSISISLTCVFIAYFGMSTVLTLALPYCMEDRNAPLIELFAANDMYVSQWIVSVGAIFGFSACLLGSMFPMPRIIYAMADDGLIFRFLSQVHKKTKTPLIATLISGLGAGIMALMFSLDALVDMMSIGTLMAYTIVSLCVMLLRYSCSNTVSLECTPLTYEPENESYDKPITKSDLSFSKYGDESDYLWKDYMRQLTNKKRLRNPTSLSASLVSYFTLVFFILSFISAFLLAYFGKNSLRNEPFGIALIVVSLVMTFLSLCVVARQPSSKEILSFRVPFVPWIPALSVFINLYLMCNLSAITWIRFAVWMIIGLLIYMFYGVENSSGSDISSTLSLPGKDNEAVDFSSGIIPPIFIQPPTPWSSRLGTPTSTVKPKSPRRVSIIDCPFLIDSDFKSDKEPNEMKLYHAASKSQSFDLSSRKLDSLEEFSSDSENDEENETNITCSKFVITATVYDASPSPKVDVPRRKSILRRTTASTYYAQESTNTPDYLKSDSPSNSSSICLIGSPKQEDEGIITSLPKSNESILDYSNVSKEKDELESASFNSEALNETTEVKISKSHPVLRSTVSAPGSTLAERTAESKHSTDFSDGSACSSEPTTPNVVRNPHKPIARVSSFDDIPPSSLTSPFAKKIKNFIIIPVIPVEPTVTADSAPVQSHIEESVYNVPKDIERNHQQSISPNTKLFQNLRSKLAQMEKDKKTKEVIGTETAINKQNSDLLPSLHTIRERGESKVHQDEIDHINNVYLI